MFRIEHDVETGEVIQIELTAAEIEALQAETAPIAPAAPTLAEKLFAATGLTVAEFKALGL